MKSLQQKTLLRKLLLRHRSNNRLWAALIALCIGTTLLLLSVLIWWNFREILSGRGSNDSLGSTFLTVGKKVTNEKMGRPEMTLFSPQEIDAMLGAPQVQDVGVLVSNRFPVWATLNTTVAFSTEMFLEAVPDRFIDNRPVDWIWTPGNRTVPIIVSSEFLNLYNYGFALSQGLPQLSQASIQSLAFDLKIGRGQLEETYSARVVGFSDRITSVLVPQTFVDYGNKLFTGRETFPPSRLILKVKDPSDKTFINYLETRDYTTNAEQLRWSKLRTVVDAVASATGLLAILLMGIGTLVFILFIELTIARAQESMALLMQLGYSPRYLGRFMLRRFLPLMLAALVLAMWLAMIAQYMAADKLKKMNLNLPHVPGWQVWAALGASALVLLAFVSRAITRAIK